MKTILFIQLLMLLFAATISGQTTTLVGTINGTADVSASGAATYQIPFEVPKGINGMEPTITLVYNSQNGNGLLGYGWNVSATSMISRTGKTYYHDDSSDAVQLDNTDNLVLDGQRLVLISGNNLANGSKYRTELESYSDITCKQAGSYLSFEVRTTDGRVLEYGTSTDSYIQAQNSSAPIYWLLKKTTDINGNTILYEYENDNIEREFYLVGIRYGGDRYIEFDYEYRNDISNAYIAGSALNMSKRLKFIRSYIGDNYLKEYWFEYIEGFYSKLETIKETDVYNSQYIPTTMEYGNENNKNFREKNILLSPYKQGHLPQYGDFNGDGLMDFVSYPVKSSYGREDMATVYLATVSGGNLSFYQLCIIPLVSSLHTFKKLFVGDMNGDNKTDIVILRGSDQYNTYVYENGTMREEHSFFTNGSEAYFGDFNGDGKQEILVKESCKVFNMFGNQLASGGIDNWGTPYLQLYPKNRYMSDLNGNGKTEFITMTGYGCNVYELSGNTFVKLNEFSVPELKNSVFPYFGDFNGDGLTDIIYQSFPYPGLQVTDVTILISTGKGFTRTHISEFNNAEPLYIGDYNRDGKSDVLYLPRNNMPVIYKIGIFNGNRFNFIQKNSDFLFPADVFFADINQGLASMLTADFNGDGYSEFCLNRYENAIYITDIPNDQSLLLTKITDGLGKATTFSYSPITSDIYSESENSYFFPKAKLRVPIYVVENMSEGMPGYTNTVNYTYKDAIMHKQGKGFQGFGEITTINSRKNQKVINTYNQYADYFYPYLSERKVTTGSGIPVSTHQWVYDMQSIGNRRFFPFLSSETITDHLKGTTETTSYSNPQYGKPRNITRQFMNMFNENISITYNNIMTGDKWIVGLPASVQTVKTRGVNSWTERSVYTYDSSYRLESKKDYTNNGNYLVSEKSYTYDDYGNPESESVKNYSSPNILTTHYEYHPGGINLKKITDPMGRAEEYFYNSLSRLSSSKDFFGKTTFYEYDQLGRLIKTTYPDGVETTIQRNWSSAGINDKYSVTETTTGKPRLTTYFDALGREVRHSTLRHDNLESKVDKVYDDVGRLLKVSMPFTGTSPSLWNYYGYDDYHRIIEIAEASGRTTLHAYNGRQITTTENGIQTARTYDATGSLINVTDPAGTITYSYRADNQTAFITAPGSIVTTFGYDDYGRQNRISDPSLGTRTYTYDAAGNLETETDAENRTITYAYDNFNRPLIRITSDGLLSPYYYNAHQLPEMEITRDENHTYQHQKLYYYDDFGRLSTVSELIGYKEFKKTYSYSQGNISSVGYHNDSGDFASENYIYSNGHLTEVKLNNTTTIWKLDASNELGQPTAVSTGNMDRAYAYTNYGFPTGRSAATSNGTVIQDMVYSFYVPTGNLTYRRDNRAYIHEVFEYDGLNRLTGYGNNTAGYNTNGNITSKSDVGSYSYNTPGKPYAMSGITLSSSAIPNRIQTVNYNSLQRPVSVNENGYEALFEYKSNGDRARMVLKQDGNVQLTRHYLGECYEIDEGVDGMKEKLYLGGDYYTAPAVYMKIGGGPWELYYIYRDFLGSISYVTDSDGNIEQELSYDAWGRLRNPQNQAVYAPGSEPELFLGRGYTGHEHLTSFGLVNMNARLYDPATSRFLSPDPYVQAPDFSQSYNRYAYAMNNPLKYTDPNGEFLELIIGGIGFLSGYLSHGITTNNWGMNAVYSGLFSSVGFTMGYIGAGFSANSLSAVFTHFSTGGAWTYAGIGALNTALSFVMPTLNIPISDNFGLILSPMAMLTSGVSSSAGGGFRVGMGISAYQKFGDWTLMAGINAGMGNVYGGFTYDDGKSGASYFHNWYTQGDRQRTGTIGLRSGEWSLRWENDVLAKDGDRFRSNATEVGYKNYFVGTNVYTTDPIDSKFRDYDINGSRIFNNKNGTYNFGHQLSSPLYMGMKTRGGITRIGFNKPVFGDFFQNGFHHLKLPFIVWGFDAMNSANFQLGDYSYPFYQSGRYLPNSLY